ncbi:uncharacterized protein BX664DRAFT_47045 [Halteromyces radiatus]|uniref:uncharacterized protein n=1 Tax=Halteromyces radiatus TaxID=101107 RepID=UPI002220C417|nr:uncharacterized protein BX664DRAFT_47045 [Halteromyces radiatus]KAI8076785.1 hypothetical protein BX664DRAFT_47045 [Halteromyces radiatus]
MIFSLVCFLLLPIGIIAANKVKNLVVFGDSYSDVGNFQRWTNGPVWSEHVTAGWNASLHSFAYSGAVCDNALFPNNTSTYYNTPSIQDQVEFYYQQHMNLDPSETVFAFWVGVNDIHHAFKEQPVVPDFNIISNCVIEQIKIIHRIFKANQIMLINLPPMEFMPYFVESTMATSRGAAVRMVNKGLKKQVEELNKKYRTLELDLVDIHSLLSDMVNDPTSFGISNKDRAYWDDCQGDCKGLEMDDYLWWDRTHLTGRKFQQNESFIHSIFFLL